MSILYWPLYPLILILSFLTGIIPPRLGYAIAWLGGSIAYYLLPNRRRVMAANYAPVLGRDPNDRQIRCIGQQSFRNFGRYLYEFLRLPHCSIDEIDRRVSLHVGEDFMQARKLGKGMIFVSAHFGNMDYAAVSVVKHIVPMTVVADMIQPKRLMDHLVEFRGKKGLRIVYQSKAARAVVEALRRNEAVGFLVDVGCNRQGGIPVTFFGRYTRFPAGPAALALRTGAPIVVGYTLVVGDRVEAYSYPPIYAQPTGNKAEDIRRCSQMIANNFEDFIRRYPEQWYMFRQMWGSETIDSSARPTEEATVQEALSEGA